MSLHQDLISLRRLLTMKPGTDGYIYVDAFDETNKNVEAYNYLTLGIRPLDSREISNERYFRIREGVEEKEGASIDQSIIPLSILMRETKISCYKLRQSFLA